MQFSIQTPVEQDYNSVFRQFNQDLLLSLTPPGVKVKLLEFEGSSKGDKVCLELDFIFFKQKWTSLITDEGHTEEEHFFTDEGEGKSLPFFLKKWKHKHRIVKRGEGSCIIDEIEYKAPLGLNYLLYPVLKFQFNYRKPIYRKFFMRKNNKVV